MLGFPPLPGPAGKELPAVKASLKLPKASSEPPDGLEIAATGAMGTGTAIAFPTEVLGCVASDPAARSAAGQEGSGIRGIISAKGSRDNAVPAAVACEPADITSLSHTWRPLASQTTVHAAQASFLVVETALQRTKLVTVAKSCMSKGWLPVAPKCVTCDLQLRLSCAEQNGCRVRHLSPKQLAAHSCNLDL